VVLVLELRAFTLNHSASPNFCNGFFWDRVSRTICFGWLQITILLIPASWVGRITGVRPLVCSFLFLSFLSLFLSFCFFISLSVSLIIGLFESGSVHVLNT
jgi:hypothetical protein